MGAITIRQAKTFSARLRGLLFSPPPPPGHALSLEPCASVHTAFMGYPIDVVFLDRQHTILRVVPRLGPWRTATCPGARQTLEFAQGEAARLGLEPGMRLTITPPLVWTIIK
jgi:uncharacterized protein